MNAKRSTCGLFFENLSVVCSSDDRAEEAEAADWPFGTPSTHERQPSAARIRLIGEGHEAAQHRLCPTECVVLAQRLHIKYTALSVSVTYNSRKTL